MTLRHEIIAGPDNADGTKPLFARIPAWVAVAAELGTTYDGVGRSQDQLGRTILRHLPAPPAGSPDSGIWITFPREQAIAIMRRAGVSY